MKWFLGPNKVQVLIVDADESFETEDKRYSGFELESFLEGDCGVVYREMV